jgi:hypothetical protein
MGTTKRRAAGTQTAIDVLLRWTWIRRRSPEGDLRDFEAGQTLVVRALSKSIGGESMTNLGRGRQVARPKAGDLYLCADEPPTFVPLRGGSATSLAAPLELRGEGERIPLAVKFRSFTLISGDVEHHLVIPAVDVALVRHALAAASR